MASTSFSRRPRSQQQHMIAVHLYLLEAHTSHGAVHRRSWGWRRAVGGGRAQAQGAGKEGVHAQHRVRQLHADGGAIPGELLEDLLVLCSKQRGPVGIKKLNFQVIFYFILQSKFYLLFKLFQNSSNNRGELA